MSEWRRFENTQGKHFKFWEIRNDGAGHTVKFGRIGTKGQRRSSQFATTAKAQAMQKRIIQGKLDKGYVEVVDSSEGEGPPPVEMDVQPRESYSKVAIGTGTKVFETSTLDIPVGAAVYVRAHGDSTRFMAGTVASAMGNVLTVHVNNCGGAGFSVWWEIFVATPAQVFSGAAGDAISAPKRIRSSTEVAVTVGTSVVKVSSLDGIVKGQAIRMQAPDGAWLVGVVDDVSPMTSDLTARFMSKGGGFGWRDKWEIATGTPEEMRKPFKKPGPARKPVSRSKPVIEKAPASAVSLNRFRFLK